jgi:uncharacterized protein (DUF924 family)
VVSPDEILAYWLDEVGPAGWYEARDDVDNAIRDRFLVTWQEAMTGACGLWLTYPAGTLAYLILTDQFPRNMFRGDLRAFVADRSARAAAKSAINRNWDMKIDEPARQFIYMPLVHSENLIDQDRAVRLFLSRMPETGATNLLHAKAHREVIRRFGRFPFRNEALGRDSTPAEAEFLAAGGYMTTVREIEAADAIA